MRESDLRLSDLFVLLLRKWRSIVTVGLVLALCLGVGAVAVQVISWANPETRALLLEEYQVKMDEHLRKLDETDLKIQTAEAQMQVVKGELVGLPAKQEGYEKSIEQINAAIQNYKDQIVTLEKSVEALKADKDEAQNQLELINAQAAISQNYESVRLRETELAVVEAELLNIPVKEAELLSSISKHEKSIKDLEAQRLTYEEPLAPDVTVVSCVVRFALFAGVGVIVGMLLAAVWILFATIARGKLLSTKQVAGLGVGALGVWPDVSGKKFLSGVDRWVIRASSKMQPDADLVCANIAAVSANQKILLCGTAAESSIDEIAAQLKQKNANIDVICAGSHMRDAKAIEGLSACDAVIMVEKLYVSDLETISDLKERAQKQNKPVLGMVLA